MPRSEMCSYDVVVTTYDVVLATGVSMGILPKAKTAALKLASYLQDYHFREDFSAQGVNLLFRMTWHRILADESHRFANPKTKLFFAMTLLKSLRKSCLTGTPIRNDHKDMWAQLRFCNFSGMVSLGKLSDSWVGDAKTLEFHSISATWTTCKCIDHDLWNCRSHSTTVETMWFSCSFAKRGSSNLSIVFTLTKTCAGRFQEP